jgi:hypothetical protein
MLLTVAVDHSLIEIGVTVRAAKKAGVVNAHICRFNAATAFTLVLVLAAHGSSAEQFAYQCAIYACAMLDTVNQHRDLALNRRRP